MLKHWTYHWEPIHRLPPLEPFRRGSHLLRVLDHADWSALSRTRQHSSRTNRKAQVSRMERGSVRKSLSPLLVNSWWKPAETVVLLVKSWTLSDTHLQPTGVHMSGEATLRGTHDVGKVGILRTTHDAAEVHAIARGYRRCSSSSIYDTWGPCHWLHVCVVPILFIHLARSNVESLYAERWIIVRA